MAEPKPGLTYKNGKWLYYEGGLSRPKEVNAARAQNLIKQGLDVVTDRGQRLRGEEALSFYGRQGTGTTAPTGTGGPRPRRGDHIDPRGPGHRPPAGTQFDVTGADDGSDPGEVDLGDLFGDLGGLGGAGLTGEELAKISADTEYTKALTDLLDDEFGLKTDMFAFDKEKFAKQFGLDERQVAELEAAGAFERGDKFEQTKKEAAASLAANMLGDRVSDVGNRRTNTINLLQTILPRSAGEGTAKALGRMFRGVNNGEAFDTVSTPVDMSAMDELDIAGELDALADDARGFFGMADGGVVEAAGGAGVLDIETLLGFDPTMEALKTGIGGLESLGDLLGYIPGDVANSLLATILPEGSNFQIPGMEGGVIKTKAQRDAEAAGKQQEWENKYLYDKLGIDKSMSEAEIKSRLEAAGISADATKYSADQGLKGSMYGSDMDYKGRVYASDKGLEGTKYSADKGLEGTRYSTDAQERLGRLSDQRERATALATMKANPSRLFESLYYQAGMGPDAGAHALDDRTTANIRGSATGSVTTMAFNPYGAQTQGPGSFAPWPDGGGDVRPSPYPFDPSQLADRYQGAADDILQRVSQGDNTVSSRDALMALKKKQMVLDRLKQGGPWGPRRPPNDFPGGYPMPRPDGGMGGVREPMLYGDARAQPYFEPPRETRNSLADRFSPEQIQSLLEQTMLGGGAGDGSGSANAVVGPAGAPTFGGGRGTGMYGRPPGRGSVQQQNRHGWTKGAGGQWQRPTEITQRLTQAMGQRPQQMARGGVVGAFARAIDRRLQTY